MIVWKVLYGELTVGIVVDKDDTLNPDTALSTWNNANPSYLGELAESAPFMEV